MRKVISLFFCILLVLGATAQKKDFSFEQIFRDSPANIILPLPSIEGWVDDDHYIELRTNEKDGKSLLMLVDVKTGHATPYSAKDTVKSALPEIEGARNITLSPDRSMVAYTKKDNNLYISETGSRKEIQLTTDGSETILNGYASWVYYEEILGRASKYKAFWWSPESRNICFMRFDQSEVPVFPIYWSDGQHGYLENQRYPKAGDKNPEVQIGIVSTDHPSHITWADFNAKDDQYFGTPIWTPAGQLWVQWMNRGQDNLKIYQVDAATGKKSEVYNEAQKTWIDLDEYERVQFLSDNKTFILKSDRDGWENLYLYEINGKFVNQITVGNFWNTSILQVDEKTRTIYFRARKENSARFDLYRINFNGKNLARMSFGEFNHEDILVSPTGKYFITTFSNLSTPPTMAVADMKGKIVRQLGSSKAPDFDKYNIAQSKLVRVKSADSLFDLPVLITYPVNFDPNKKYPVLITIYGGPNAGSVYDRWRPVSTNQWFSQEGMIIVAMDNRSSGHFGKNGMNFIHRQMGRYEIEDYMTCGKWLRAQPWVDSNRVAITGSSFGGYLTCMALTYGADVFTHGIASSSVTDWHLYDTHYTERYMDSPAENPGGYENTSVLNYVSRYKGLLRITHGGADDNVHMQNTIQLINKLEDLKKHFELMIYPGERHGISGVKREHNRAETYRFYYEQLLRKPMPQKFFSGDDPKKGF